MRFWLALLLCAPSLGFARVFDYKDARVAAYVRTTGGLSALGQTAFKDSSGTGTSVEGKPLFSYSGEIGFMAGIGSANLRIGAELLQHRPLSDAKGTNSGGTELFTLNSSVSAFIPGVTLEFPFHPQGNTRMYFHVGAGYADVTVENRYKMTAAGTSAFGVGDFDELMSGTAISYHTGVGFEALLNDSVTLAADIGYRLLKVSSLKYKTDANTIQSPSGVSKGDAVKNAGGGNRSLDLGGLTVGIAFRFYLNVL